MPASRPEPKLTPGALAEFGLNCEYIRERKKRGKASRKDLAQQAAAQAAAAAAAQNGQKSDGHQNGDNGQSGAQGADVKPVMGGDQAMANDKVMNDLGEDAMQASQRTSSMDSLADMGAHQSHLASHPADHLDGSAGLDLNGYGNVHSSYDRQGMSSHMMNGAAHAQYAAQAPMSNYPELPYTLQSQSPTSYSANANSFRMGTSPLSAYPMAGETTSPGWMSMSSPPPPVPDPHAQQLQPHPAAPTPCWSRWCPTWPTSSRSPPPATSSTCTSRARHRRRCTRCRPTS